MRLGTRGSNLALAQAEFVSNALGSAEVVPVRTADSGPGDKERFVRGVEEALIAGEVDLGVHSAKDLPGELPGELMLAGVPAREEPSDAYVGAGGSLAEIPRGARVGTSSLRRRSQLLALRPDLEVVELRGNVDTRMRKLREEDLDGIVLATAGLARLGIAGEIAFRFEVEAMTPAPGQGALALEARRDDAVSLGSAAAITDEAALLELTAERAATRVLEASCHTPVGVCARLGDGELTVYGYAGLADGGEWVRDSVRGDAEQPVALGESLAERMLAAGARDILDRADPGRVGS